MNHYDYLIVGAGLYGAVFAQQAKKAGKTCLVIDRRSHIAGNIYTEEVEGIHVIRRNPQLRQMCLDKYGYQCQCCGMDFEEIGRASCRERV